MTRVYLKLMSMDDFNSMVSGLGETVESVISKYEGDFKSVISTYRETLSTNTIKTIETKFSEIEGMTEEIEIEVINFLKENFGNGPNFDTLEA